MDERSIEDPQERRDVQEDAPVEGERSGDAGDEGERVSKPGEGLVTEEGVNERS